MKKMHNGESQGFVAANEYEWIEQSLIALHNFY